VGAGDGFAEAVSDGTGVSWTGALSGGPATEQAAMTTASVSAMA
jgi:hypothetical protein